MRPRRAQGISVNVIIIAAIALVVMVILIALVLQSGQKLNPAANACTGIPGEQNTDWRCVFPPQESCADYGMVKHPSRGCAGASDTQPITCCFRI